MLEIPPKPTVGRARLLLAEDHRDLAEQLRALLAQEFDVVAVVGDGFAMIDAAEDLEPDVIVADISMPGLDGLTAATAIRRHRPDARIVFISVHDEPALVNRAYEVGALAYVRKFTAGDALIPAIHGAVRGERELPWAVPAARTPGGPDG